MVFGIYIPIHLSSSFHKKDKVPTTTASYPHSMDPYYYSQNNHHHQQPPPPPQQQFLHQQQQIQLQQDQPFLHHQHQQIQLHQDQQQHHQQLLQIHHHHQQQQQQQQQQIQQQQQQQFQQQQQQQQQQIQQQQQQQQQIQQQQQQQQSYRSLQGPRPKPLHVKKESFISKPPAGRSQSRPPPNLPPPPQHRQPVIIYTVSPKVIHTKPGDFMALVQSLTGVNSSPSAAAAASRPPTPLPSPGFPGPAGAISPATRLATIEKAQRAPEATKASSNEDINNVVGDERIPSGFVGILSPNPSSLPGIAPGMFSGSDLNSLGFLHDMMSPAVTVNRNYMDNSFLTSPIFPFSPTFPSPNWDLFRSFTDGH